MDDELLRADERAVVARAIREVMAQRQGDGEEMQERLWRLYLDARVAGLCREDRRRSPVQSTTTSAPNFTQARPSLRHSRSDQQSLAR